MNNYQRLSTTSKDELDAIKASDKTLNIENFIARVQDTFDTNGVYGMKVCSEQYEISNELINDITNLD